MKTFVIILLAVSTLSACTKFVWENREECPCVLTLDLSSIDRNVSELHLWMFGEGNSILYRDTIPSGKFGGTYDVLIKREIVKYYVWGNIKGATRLQDNLTINSTLTKVENSSADSLYHYSKQLNTNVESQVDTVYLNKEFITLHFYVEGQHEQISSSDMIIEIAAVGDGYYLDGSIINKKSNVQSTPSNKYCSMRLTRQDKLDDMYLLLYSKTGTQKVLIDKYPLGTLLKENRYDMYSFSLQDIIIEIDLKNNFINLLLTT